MYNAACYLTNGIFMPDIEVILTGNIPPETVLYDSVHEAIKLQCGKLTPASIVGILTQIQLEVMQVYDDDEGYTT